MTQICIPINEKDPQNFRSAFRSALKSADIIEVWLDELKEIGQETLTLLNKSKKPILYKVTAKKPKVSLKDFSPHYIDFDLKTPAKILKAYKGPQLIISHHDFKKTPSDKALAKLIAKMDKFKPDIYKLATSAKDFSDSLRMLQLLNQLQLDGKQAICICMGSAGRITRAAGHLLGNYLMFAPQDEQKATAPGQLTLKELRAIYNLI